MSARLFVALTVAPADRDALAAWAQAAVGGDPGLRLVAPEQLHLTLAFLGHRPLDDVEVVAGVVGALDAAVPVLRTSGPLWLSPRRPHVLTVGLEDDAALSALHAELWAALGDRLGVEPERRRLRPHVTVARLRRGWPPPTRRLPALPPRTLTAQDVVLFRSWLGRGPARYETLARRPVGLTRP